MSISIRPSVAADGSFVVSAFDSAIEWLVAKGHQDQWGSEPWSKTRGAAFTERMEKEAAGDPATNSRGWIAEVNGKPAAFVSISANRPPYLPRTAEEDLRGKELYVKVLITHRSFQGLGLGARLLALVKEQAVTDVEFGAEWVRLDCWRGGEGKEGLVKFYESCGFVKVKPFDIPPTNPSNFSDKPWTGYLLEWRVRKD